MIYMGLKLGVFVQYVMREAKKMFEMPDFRFYDGIQECLAANQNGLGGFYPNSLKEIRGFVMRSINICGTSFEMVIA